MLTKRILSCLFILFIIFIVPLTLFSEEITNDDCMECHDDKEATKTNDKGIEILLFIDMLKFTSSMHGDFECIDCHSGITELPHDEELTKPDCGSCHEDVSAEYLESFHGKALSEGDNDAPDCWSCHNKHYIFPAEDSLSWINPANLPATCAKCHSDPTIVKRHHIPIPNPSAAYTQSIHFKAISKKGIVTSAACNDCHGAHTLQPAEHPGSMINRRNIPKTCSQCHESIYEIYMESIHGQGLLAGVSDAPTCTDCHSEHNIKEHTDPTSTVFSTVVSKTTCARCHEAERIVSKYGLAKKAVKSYNDSYHGLATRGGSTVSANCASCHGIHDIRPSSDPKSSIHKENLKETCSKCHPGVTAQVALGKIHITPSQESSRLIYYITMLYISLIVVVIGGMVIHNGLDFFKKLRAKYHGIPPQHDEEVGSITFVRLSLNEKIQHVLLFVSFTLLVITGFALKFPESLWAAPFGIWEGGFAFRSFLHRLSGFIMIAASFYHLFYLIGTKRGRQQVLDLLPKMKDLWDVLQMLKYYLGFSAEKPAFARYNYMEKAEYWALIWGTLVMSVTGLVLWFQNLAMMLFPKWITDVSTVIHYYEAILASLAILVWHFYFQFFDPHVYPMNFTCITGKMSAENMKEEHPLEFEKLEQEAK